jgi:hypothetical protein
MEAYKQKLKDEFTNITSQIYAKNRNALSKKVTAELQKMLNDRIKTPMRDDKSETLFTINTLNTELSTIRNDLKKEFASYYNSIDGSDTLDAKVLDATLPLINEFITTETR